MRNNGTCSWPRGRNLGGTSVHHGMAYHRGHAKDYEKWVDMGNEGWSWIEVNYKITNYIKRIINYALL